MGVCAKIRTGLKNYGCDYKMTKQMCEVRTPALQIILIFFMLMLKILKRYGYFTFAVIPY